MPGAGDVTATSAMVADGGAEANPYHATTFFIHALHGTDEPI